MVLQTTETVASYVDTVQISRSNGDHMSVVNRAELTVQPFRHPGRRFAPLVLLLLISTLFSACGSDAKPVPDVVGIQLDEAHRTLKAQGFEKFEDTDKFGDRAVLLDSNWVVLAQNPQPEAQSEPGTVVNLQVGKIGEVRTKKALPRDSPVLARMLADEASKKRKAEERAKAEAAKDAAQAKADAAKKAEQAREHAAAASQYVNGIDPAARLAVKNHVELAKLGRQVSNGSVDGQDLTENVLGASEALTMLETILSAGEPSDAANLDRQHEQLLASVTGFKQAALTLLSADGASRKSSIERFNTVYAKARADWNAAIKASYTAGRVTNPPLIS